MPVSSHCDGATISLMHKTQDTVLETRGDACQEQRLKSSRHGGGLLAKGRCARRRAHLPKEIGFSSSPKVTGNIHT